MTPKTDGLQKPGEKPQGPGEYQERGPRGGEVPNSTQVTIDRRDGHLPPTQKPGRTWQRQQPSRKK